jgi:hypothetical protein
MMGRALRGPAVGGSEKVYRVSFEDHWDSLFDLVPDIQAVVSDKESKVEAIAEVNRFLQHLP